jgi:hypothetical protein
MADNASTVNRRKSGRIITVSLHASSAVVPVEFSNVAQPRPISLPNRRWPDYRQSQSETLSS